jgi:hypothetical protein
MRATLVALLLVVGSGPEGVPNGFRGPFHERLSPEGGALPAPMDPGFIAAPFRHRRDARILLECIGGGVTCTLFAEGDEQARGTDRTGAWQGGKQGEVGMALGALRDGMVEVCDRLQDAPELGDESLHHEGMRGDDALSSRQWSRALDGLDARVDDVSIAHVVGAEAALQGGAAGQLGSFEGGPWGEEVTEERGVFVVKPLQGVWEVVFQRRGEAVGQAHVVANQAAAMFDEWLERTHPGALGDERLTLVAMPEQELELQCSGSGGVFRMTGSEGFAVLGQGNRIDGEQHQELVFAEGRDERAFGAFETHRNGLSCTPLLEGPCPGLDGLGFVFETTELPYGVANGLSADSVCGIGPIDAHEGGEFF